MISSTYGFGRVSGLKLVQYRGTETLLDPWGHWQVCALPHSDGLKNGLAPGSSLLLLEPRLRTLLTQARIFVQKRERNSGKRQRGHDHHRGGDADEVTDEACKRWRHRGRRWYRTGSAHACVAPVQHRRARSRRSRW